MSTDTCIGAPFNFLWIVENYSELTYIDLKSPLFKAESISKYEWYLQIDENFDFSCWLQSEDAPREEISAIDIEVSLLGADGSSVISKKRNESNLSITLFTRDGFLERWAEIIPNNTLTIQCRMWRKGREIETNDLCYARTKLKTHTGTFLWPVEDFSELHSCAAEDFTTVPPEEKKVYPLKPLTDDGPFMALILYVKQNSESEDVCVDLLVEKGRDYGFGFELSVVDANGEVVQSYEERGCTLYSWAFFRFWPVISKSKLISAKDFYLPNDTLLLKCSYEVFAGVISSEIEYITPNVSSIVRGKKYVTNFMVIGAEEDKSLKFLEYFLTEEAKKYLADDKENNQDPDIHKKFYNEFFK